MFVINVFKIRLPIIICPLMSYKIHNQLLNNLFSMFTISYVHSICVNCVILIVF